MRWESKPYTEESIAAFKDACAKFGFGPEQVTLISMHISYDAPR